MSNNKQSCYITDTCHLHIPCPSQSRCSAKSHSSSCLSSQCENQYYEGGGGNTRGPLWFTITKDEEFPRLITSPPKDKDQAKKSKKTKKKKKLRTHFDDSVKRTHKCRRVGGCKRQRLHSEDSSNKRNSGIVARDMEQSKRARLAVAVVALSLIMLSFFLVGLTLRMAPIIDELGEFFCLASLTH